MGFFSWKTADSEESIFNIYSEAGAKPVYLLQPNGEKAIEELAYEGYGVFGGTDAYVWLAKANLPAEDMQSLSEDQLRDIGISLDLGAYYVDAQTGRALTVFHQIRPEVQKLHGLEPLHLQVTYDTNLDDFDGLTANELIASGRWTRVDLPAPPHPIKLSFRADARYEDLPASDSCPYQGFFHYEEDEAA